MRTITRLRNVVDEVPEITERARRSLDNLDGGVRRANATMLILGGVAVVALVLATVAILRAEAISRA